MSFSWKNKNHAFSVVWLYLCGGKKKSSESIFIFLRKILPTSISNYPQLKNGFEMGFKNPTKFPKIMFSSSGSKPSHLLPYAIHLCILWFQASITLWKSTRLHHQSALIWVRRIHASGFGEMNGWRSFRTSREIRQLLHVLPSQTRGVTLEKLQRTRPSQIPAIQS